MPYFYRMRKVFLLLGLGIMVFAGCASGNAETGNEENAYSQLGQNFDHKNPQLPTKFVDTTGSKYAWAKMYNPVQSLKNRIKPPVGYIRKPLDANSFGNWLRGLPLKPGNPKVMLYNGSPKEFQDAQFAVLDIDVGNRDLQQCADAVMRLRSEYLYSIGAEDSIHFKFTSGANCPWSKWKAGFRPVISGSNVSWKQSKPASDSYENFRAYLNVVFTYAGTSSLEKELKYVGSLKKMEIGDVFIQGGFPGHCVIVVDVVEEEETGKRKYLLAQSFMPAQDIHILRNPFSEAQGPWYDAEILKEVITPEWTFLQKDLRRF